MENFCTITKEEAKNLAEKYGFDIENEPDIQDYPFAIACFDNNTIDELTKAMEQPANIKDCENWGITKKQFHYQIKLALHAILCTNYEWSEL